MSAAVIVQPSYTPPYEGGSPGWEHTQVTFTDDYGVTWDFTDPSGGAFLMQAGVRGLGSGSFTHIDEQTPAVAGSTWLGLNVNARECFWPLFVFHDGTTAEFVERNRLLFRGLRPRRQGTWTVRVPGVSERSLRVRMVDDGDYAPVVDPNFYGWEKYGITLVANQPFWTPTSPISNGWQAGVPLDFHNPPGGVIHIGSGSTAASASITNPGDEEAYVTWILEGPIEPGAEIEVDGRLITWTEAIPDGETIRIDTRPDQNTVIDQDGVDRFEDGLGEYQPRALQPEIETPIGLTFAGAGKISYELYPLYYRAW